MEPPRLQVELEESANGTLDRCREARPTNTTRAYAPKQKEFKAWCERKCFHETTRYQVTAAKMHLFLSEEVVDREVRVKNSTRKIGVATVEMYVNAISDLYNDQQSRGANTHPHPRNNLIKALLSSLKREKHEKNKREFVDRGVGSLLDGYCTTEDLVAISRYHINLNTGSDLRNRMSHFLCHSCLLRGESARNLELPDINQQHLQTIAHIDSKVSEVGASVNNLAGAFTQLTSVLQRTVHQVWQEWSVGIHGGPAVRDLEESHGSSWRRSAADKRFFFRRKRIIDHIVATAQAKCISHEQSVCAVEAHRHHPLRRRRGRGLRAGRGSAGPAALLRRATLQVITPSGAGAVDVRVVPAQCAGAAAFCQMDFV
ncbi:hypothetical protein ON010_g11790 [Phytophthora cinnamomi]|nr:hypothetical protein ON010_g11790 [Phytophthora cinnamomi]